MRAGAANLQEFSFRPGKIFHQHRNYACSKNYRCITLWKSRRLSYGLQAAFIINANYLTQALNINKAVEGSEEIGIRSPRWSNS